MIKKEVEEIMSRLENIAIRMDNQILFSFSVLRDCKDVVEGLEDDIRRLMEMGQLEVQEDCFRLKGE